MLITSWLRSKNYSAVARIALIRAPPPRRFSMAARVDRICASIKPDLYRHHVPDQSSPNRREISPCDQAGSRSRR